MVMKLSDYVIDFLVKKGVRHFFGLTGGAAVHFFDSVYRHPQAEPVFNHHEQAGAFAAEAYGRMTNNLGVGIFTTGPGGTNSLTGLCAAWQDSIPCVYISGQTRAEHSSRGKPVRQVGTQEFDIVPVVSHMSKYAVTIETPEMIRYHLEKAVFLARHGRPGPVWIDVPLNFQWAMIDPLKLRSFIPSQEGYQKGPDPVFARQVRECCEMLEQASRPLILAGYGVRLSEAIEELNTFLDKTKIPFVSSWAACDLIRTDHPSYMGRPGIAGQRGANLAVQNCDLLLSIGSHLCIPITGTNYSVFARGAKRIVVNIDKGQIDTPTVRVDLAIQADAKIFLQECLKYFKNSKLAMTAQWKSRCDGYKKYNGLSADRIKQKKLVDQYVFVDRLSNVLNEDDAVVIDGGGTIVYTAFQSLKIKTGQRVVLTTGICSMGSGLPESIGVCFASGKKRTICLCGDGSMQLNIQELQTIVHHRLPIKIFLFSNKGYLSIRGTQDGFLDGRHAGSDAAGGMSLPDYKKVARAYGIKVMQISSHRQIEQKIRQALRQKGPVVCEILVPADQEILPRQGFDKRKDGVFVPRSLEDMFPYLSREEFLRNMIVEPLPTLQD